MEKHLRKFSTHTQYEEYINSQDKLLPNVSYCEDQKNLYYNPNLDYVDLGLPSGTLWAKTNLGAEREIDYGNYYMYGKTTTYNAQDTPYTGVENPLNLSLDVANQILGDNWHIPTRAQLIELRANTTFEWINNYQNTGVNGAKFTAQNGKYIFIPAAGYYMGSDFEGVTPGEFNAEGEDISIWSSTPDGSTEAYMCDIIDVEVFIGSYSRDSGYSIRPVK